MYCILAFQIELFLLVTSVYTYVLQFMTDNSPQFAFSLLV